ncbi:hypothetical protein FA95DRAFT_1555910 [Auriscalpium vulgare]|uniref:Uncharacterized protein n=1 Tax=Auriscalpium vulgare TaxID=40419 RepID=A0ACB8S239_9AGAM|nr:hypothetical protein FA95DRAFT_1555910 [Auriscalpium vulgare]
MSPSPSCRVAKQVTYGQLIATHKTSTLSLEAVNRPSRLSSQLMCDVQHRGPYRARQTDRSAIIERGTGIVMDITKGDPVPRYDEDRQEDAQLQTKLQGSQVPEGPQQRFDYLPKETYSIFQNECTCATVSTCDYRRRGAAKASQCTSDTWRRTFERGPHGTGST